MPLLHAERLASLRAGLGEEVSEIGFADTKAVRRSNTKQRAMEEAKGRIVNGSVSVKDRMFEVSGQKVSEHKDGRHATYLYMSIYASIAPRTFNKDVVMMSSVPDFEKLCKFCA